MADLFQGAPTPDSTPRIHLSKISNNWNDLHLKLHTGRGLPDTPFWMEIGSAGFRITDENRQSLALGMLLCLDVRAHFEEST